MADLPIATFLTERLDEYDSTFELRTGTGFERLFFEPMQFIVQPLRDEMDTIETGQSFRLILAQANPDAFDQEAVDALTANLFVFRRQGGVAGGVARAFYDLPVDRQYPAGGAIFTASNNETFTNPAPFTITSEEMSLNISGGLYYFDIPVQDTVAGTKGNILANQLISLANDTDVVSVTNLLAFTSGAITETNTQLINRTQQSIGARDLVTGGGFQAILFENFVSSLIEVQPIGFGDPEMQRDIVYNVHIGGRVDGYAKTAAIQSGSANFIGLLIDTTRQSFTSANVELEGTTPETVGNPNIDRTIGAPVVTEIKNSIPATFTSLQDLTAPADLSVDQYVRIGINGDFLDIRIAGVNPAATTRNEILALINNAFGTNVASVVTNISGNFLKITSPTAGLTSQVVITNPTVGTSALSEAFGLDPLSAPFTFNGDGPVTYLEGVNYAFNDVAGLINRVIGATILPLQTTGHTTHLSATFTDPTTNQFLNVLKRDILTILSGPDAGDYRILNVNSNNSLTLDKPLTTTATTVSYSITRTGIKSGEIVYVTYYFNPLSIDIGNLVKLDPFGVNRGIRPGRENQTITDLAFLRITSIQIIDPITFQPVGEILNGLGGYGQGGYGLGGYGIGAGADYHLVVNSPTERFSAFEDSYIVINNGFAGLSFQVNYDFVPEIVDYHNFVRAAQNRVLDGDILMKHYLPAYVSGTINYSVDNTDTSIPTNAALTVMVQAFITSLSSGVPLDVSVVEQYITSVTDPNKRFKTHIQPFTLTALIQNVNGTVTGVVSGDQLVVPTPNPFPSQTNQPLSPRITHWIGDNIVMVRS